MRRRFLARALEGLPPRPPTLLEVGPGPGRFSNLLLATGRPVISLELSPAMIQEALRHRGSSGGPHWVLGDGLRLPVRPGSLAGLVALGNVLGFSGDRAGLLLREWKESLAPGGIWVIETSVTGTLPAEGSARDAHADLRRAGREPFYGPPTALLRFPRAELDRWFDLLGWELLEATPVAPGAGGSPERARQALAQAGGRWETLLEKEERAGRQREAQILPGPWLFRGRALARGE